MPYLFSRAREGPQLRDIPPSASALTITTQEGDLLEIVRSRHNSDNQPQDSAQATLPAVTLRRNDFRSSTKLEALVKHLRTYPFNPFP